MVAHCPLSNQKFPNATPPTQNIQPPPNRNTQKPQANTVSLSAASTSSPWLLDSGASHHVTANLNNLSLHAPYDGIEELVVGDGKGLRFTHFGSGSLSSLKLNNVLVVPFMSRNIISISQLC